MEMKSKVSVCRNRLILIMLLNFSDWLCTVTLLHFQGFYEANPLMLSLLDKPLLCFVIKCILPLLLIGYIYYILPKSTLGIVKLVGIIMLLLGGFYLLINILHILNFLILFILG